MGKLLPYNNPIFMSDLQSSIHPEALDLILGSATNAAQKGQSQYSTPVELAQELAKHLCHFRPIVIDLTCGPGNLVAGSANKSTENLLGLDVDPRSAKRPAGIGRDMGYRFIQADLTALYASMRQINFRADCFVLNPPWSMSWHVERLEGLADSEVPAVAKTFKAMRVDGDTIDSTLATFMIALDRLTQNGGGLLVGYTSTLDRLIFSKGAPGAMLAQHVWKRIPLVDVVPAETLPDPLKLSTAIFFSVNHEDGPTADGNKPQYLLEISAYRCRRDTITEWLALADRAKSLQTSSLGPQPFHLSLHNGTIHVRLGLFDTALTKVNGELKKAAERLYKLNGRNPMQVVMQRDERNFVLGLIRQSVGRDSVEPCNSAQHLWTVDPVLRKAVQQSLNEYDSIRAPLVRLPKIQRLGYLDENDDILCLKDLCLDERLIFQAGERYPLATQSVRFTRTQMKPNLHGFDEELELSGQELAILIQARPDPSARQKAATRKVLEPSEGKQFRFMDAALRAGNVKIGSDDGSDYIHFTLQNLVEHFDIPEVPPIAETNPDQYQSFIGQLHRLEQFTAA